MGAGLLAGGGLTLLFSAGWGAVMVLVGAGGDLSGCCGLSAWVFVLEGAGLETVLVAAVVAWTGRAGKWLLARAGRRGLVCWSVLAGWLLLFFFCIFSRISFLRGHLLLAAECWPLQLAHL